MTLVMALSSLRQEAFTSALPATSQRSATALGSHSGAKSVLTFSRPLRALESAFHGRLGAATVKDSARLSIGGFDAASMLR